MRNTLRTPFWQAAYRSLPQTIRRRYLADIERAERWELALDSLGDALWRATRALRRLLNTAKPSSAH